VALPVTTTTVTQTAHLQVLLAPRGMNVAFPDEILGSASATPN
jgi:hypothetical protein